MCIQVMPGIIMKKDAMYSHTGYYANRVFPVIHKKKNLKKKKKTTLVIIGIYAQLLMEKYWEWLQAEYIYICYYKLVFFIVF